MNMMDNNDMSGDGGMNEEESQKDMPEEDEENEGEEKEFDPTDGLEGVNEQF